MSLNLTQYPTGLCFLNKVTRFVMTADNVVTLWLALDPIGQNEEIFAGRYHPGLDGRIEVDVTGIVKDYVKTTVPTGENDYVQTGFAKTFGYKIEEDEGGSEDGTFAVANLAVDTEETVEQWCASHFLTHQAAERRTNYESPEWLTYYDHEGDWIVAGRFYPRTGGMVDMIVKADEKPGCQTVNVNYARLIPHVARLPHQLKGYYDIILYDGNLNELCRQRYLYHERSGQEHYYLFVNPLGGVDTVIADGGNVLEPETTLNYGRFGDRFVPIDDTENIRKWKQSLLMEWRDRNWWHELMATRGEAAIYSATRKVYEKIVVTGADISMTDKGQIAMTTFDYLLAEASEILPASEETSRGLTQSAADMAEELTDLSSAVAVAMEPDGQGGFETEELEIPATMVFVTDPRTVVAASEEPVYYYIGGSLTAEDSFTPGVTPMPVVIEKGVSDTIRFATQNDKIGSLDINYYPETIQT